MHLLWSWKLRETNGTCGTRAHVSSRAMSVMCTGHNMMWCWVGLFLPLGSACSARRKGLKSMPPESNRRLRKAGLQNWTCFDLSLRSRTNVRLQHLLGCAGESGFWEQLMLVCDTSSGVQINQVFLGAQGSYVGWETTQYTYSTLTVVHDFEQLTMSENVWLRRLRCLTRL